MSPFQKSNYRFNLVVFRIVMRVVLAFEVVSPKESESLIEEGSDLATEFLNHLVGGVARLAIDEADEDGT